ncbi:MAG: hypothetical protein QOG80_2106 [Pseudonocardiales bacterium]|nr:hypothetical protein [Pseudonocardiales bacterium]
MVTFPRRVLAAVAGVVLASTLAACHSSTGSSAAPSLAQVRALLGRHAQAVLGHSAAAFLADVDTATAAGTFRGRQRAEIAALAGMPLAEWAYAVVAPVTDGKATATASTRYGAPALIVHLELTFRLRPAEPTPTTHDLDWTFVRRAGRILVAGDDDMAGLGGASWRGPWDFGPIVAREGATSLVLAHPDQSAALPSLGAAAEAAVSEVTSVIGAGWARRVTVVVPSSNAEFDALAGGGPYTDVAAVTVFGGGGGTAGAAWVVVRADQLARLSATGERIVLAHEVTHVAMAAATTPISPRWLIEGFAEYVGNLGTGQPVGVAAGELAAAVRRGTLPSTLPSDTAFDATGSELARVYEESWLACRYLAARVGAKGLVAFYGEVGRSGAPNDTATADVLASTLHESLPVFLMKWRAYLKTELS